MCICNKLLLSKKKILCFIPVTPFSLSLSCVAASAHRYSSGMWQETTEQLASWQGRGGLPTATHWLVCVLGSGRQTLLQYALPGEIYPQKSWLFAEIFRDLTTLLKHQVEHQKNQIKSVLFSCWKQLYCASSQHHFCRFWVGFLCIESSITRNSTDKTNAESRWTLFPAWI